MHKTNIITINVQEGLLVSEDYKQVFAFYSTHNTIMVVCHPWKEDDFEIPSHLESYYVSPYDAQHISITGWADGTDRDTHWFRKEFDKGVKESLRKSNKHKSISQ